MAQEGPPISKENSLEGQTVRPNNRPELQRVIEQAFDYRGDVTIELSTGELVEGYLFNRESQGPSPWIRLFEKAQDGERVIPYEDIVAISFTGQDTAFGKSWEDWIQKKQKMKNP